MASTKTLVQTTAQVITVLDLKRGDVYKRLVKNYADTYEIKMGVVTDVMDNGEDSAITALEFASDYSGTTAKVTVFGTNQDIKIFPATVDEVAAHMTELEEKASDDVRKKRSELAAAEDVQARIMVLKQQAHNGELNAPSTTTTQAQAVIE